MSDLIEKLIHATAWSMDKPPAYGAFHLLFVLFGFSAAIFVAYKLRNLGDKGHRVLMLGIGLFLMVCEIYKQLFYFYYFNDRQYEWGVFPFHLCSIPMYFCVIVALLKKGSLQRSMLSFMMMYNLLSGAIAFTEPSGLLHDYWTLTLHAFIWHLLIFFVGLYLAFSGRGGSEISDYWASTKVFLALCVIAFLINVMVIKVFQGNINMFFVGPRNSSLVVFKQISEYFGWYVSTALYIPSVCLGAYLCFLPIRLLRKRNTMLKSAA